MKSLRLVSVLAACIFFATSAFATTPPPAKPVSPVTVLSVETTPVRHAKHSNGPLVINWQFTKARGAMNLIVNSDGTYLFSGNYKGLPPWEPQANITYDFSILLALTSSLGGMILFRYRGLANGHVLWSEHGRSATLKDDFKTFATKLDYAGRYHVGLTSSGKSNLYSYCTWLESIFGKEWANQQGQVFYGWSPAEISEWNGDHCPY